MQTNNKLFCSRLVLRQGIDRLRLASVLAVLTVSLLSWTAAARAGDAPAWMHALVDVTLPEHDEKTDAVLLYSGRFVLVQSAEKIKITVREAFKILRPSGREYGTLVVPYNSHQKITAMRAWCIPSQGKDYEIKDKEAVEISLPKIEGSELITDVKDRLLRIPAADPGNIVGYEYEKEDQPFVLQDIWRFQQESPVREARYSLQLPSGWEYKVKWMNYPEIKPVESGIGGWQPNAAPEVFTHHYGDCKDKATLMGAMLQEIGVDSYYVIINSERGSVTPETPAHKDGFDHAIIAVKLPDSVVDASLMATIVHPKLGRLLFFDPTDELTPFGQLNGALQANYGLLVGPDGGELVELPVMPPAMNGIRRAGKLTLDAFGTLTGDVQEIRVGDRASSQRWALRTVNKDTDKIKPIETLLSHSLATFEITKASVGNLQSTDLPFVYNYSVTARNYAKPAGNLLLLRPRFIGNKSSDLLETKEPRKYPVEFDGPSRDTDTFEIALPPGYDVVDLLTHVDSDYSFASYHSKAEVHGSMLKYTRTFEVKELSVPVSKVEDLKKLYRIIASDERNAAVLKPTSH